MILLEAHNRVIEELLTDIITSYESGAKPKIINTIAADFDAVLYHVSTLKDRSKIMVSIALRFYEELKPYKVEELLRKIYGPLLVDPEDGYSVSLLIDLAQLPQEWKPLVREVARLKRNCTASVFEYFFDLQQNGCADKPRAIIHYRDEETMYVNTLEDRVTIIYSTVFKDPDDMVIGRVFMQEFKEGRRSNQLAPQVLFSNKNPPLELMNTDANIGENRGYITFVLLPQHIGEKNRSNTIDLMHTLRNYLHYHIKCSKAFIHARMRLKTNELLKVLNRARPEPKTKMMKTISGRTFIPRINNKEIQ